jgi:hypothetical protein
MSAADDVARTRLARSGLVEPFAAAADVARALIGVQSQFVPPAGLAIMNRLAEPFTDTDLDALLHERRSLLRLWGQRNTVHVYHVADWPTVVSASRAIPSYRQRLTDRLGRTDADLEQALDRMTSILAGVERASRSDLAQADPSLAPWLQWGNIPIIDLVRRGDACHAGVVGGRSYFAHRDVWLPDVEWVTPSTDDAAVSLARRYFATYGPATVHDFAFWLGARAGDARRWVRVLRDELVELDVDGELYLDLALSAGVGPSRGAPAPDEPPPLLLHRFDPLLLAHKNKSWIVDDAHYKAVWRKAGYVEAVVLEGGRIVGTWAYDRRATGIAVTLSPFGTLRRGTVTALKRRAERIAAYFDQPLLEVAIE